MKSRQSAVLNRGMILPALGALFLALLPFWVGEYFLSVSIITGIYIVMLSGLALFLGYGGQFSFAQAVFYGVGAYTSSLLSLRLHVPPEVALLAAGAVAGVIAFLLSSPIIRLRGYYLAMATLALTHIFHVLLIRLYDLTGGPTGIYGIPYFSLLGFTFNNSTRFHYLVWVLVLIVMVFMRNLMSSRIGRALKAIQTSEEAATVLGVNTAGLKTKIFVITGVTGGLAGGLFAHYVSFIAPGNFTGDLSIWVVVILAIGGVRNLLGIVVGAAFTTVFPFLLGRFQQFNMLVFGLILVLVLKYLPGGVSGLIGQQLQRLKKRFERGAERTGHPGSDSGL